MQNYELTLKSDVHRSFRCTKAANSLDIDVEAKSVHRFSVAADLATPYNVGLIVGASGSGKTTLAKHIFGNDCFTVLLDDAKPVIDQLPAHLSYDDCAAILAGVGLTSVPCWIRPAATLSNGQKARAECALQMAAQSDDTTVIDEWTSVVDRTVAKVMSHCIQKHARKTGKRIVLLSCHYDVIDWLNPDWVIDANRQQYTDRRSLCRSFQRSEKITFDIREVGRETWSYFSRYHYLSHHLPGGHIETFGLFSGADQIGFQCFANYVPHTPGTVKQMHSNRTVIHPDYAGMGLGIRLINEASAIMAARGFDVRAKFSSTPIYLSMSKQVCWKLLKVERTTKPNYGGKNSSSQRMAGARVDTKTYSFRYIPQAETP